MRNGEGICYFEDGGCYFGDWKDDTYQGKGIYIYSDG